MIPTFDKRDADPGEIWTSEHAEAVVMLLRKIPDNFWLSHTVLVLDGSNSHFLPGRTRDVNLASDNACWVRVS